MLTNQDFIRLFSIEHNLIKMQTEGLTQADTLIQPQPSGNCMNWVLGHTLENQVGILKLLGQEPPVDEAELEIYRRESAPISADGPQILSLESLLEGHEKVHKQLAACLAGMTDADFAREMEFRGRTVTLGWRFLFLHFHYTYHVGQLELLRQLAGRSEKLI
jgi:hypothetical protein